MLRSCLCRVAVVRVVVCVVVVVHVVVCVRFTHFCLCKANQCGQNALGRAVAAGGLCVLLLT